MKRTLLALVLAPLMMGPAMAAQGGCGFDNQAEGGLFATCEEEKKEVILTGLLGFEELRQQPGYEANFDAYQADAALVAKLAAIDTPTELVVIVGTWCPDCHRETPRLAKILAEANNPNLSVKYIGIDRSRTDPEGLAAQYDFQRIPTVLVFQEGEEQGRIVERPTSETLEQDLINILGTTE
ncbi:thioredoxin family protein [Ferrimonas balearica]|uniref:thioredoxin family protein n=1 Tax=Ferrimonas balearica TaxID=44012 RepID=UPI001C586B2F|nr:thioredoxin family protein [Ferrimonas balearica]MBY6019212.1 thioredoxin family protein [Halomonas denitrificans]MBW3140880.1 thioredoxin family protein [Ferrimonas balearica]MBY6095815.1 thioredoxin family protein [Ferrimonas balearica]MBY6108095.1 thioredoxin family protein [Ferrimonas balearica]MBY6225436.1 thioredoxin family protein [Ferrimonas balearica]